MFKIRNLIPVLFLSVFFGLIFGPLYINNLVAAPMDTLVGAYFPWLEYKWGYPVGVPVKNGLISDVFNTFFNWKHLGTTQFFQGVIPAWNPYEFLGSPLLATFHSALLHPLNILFLLPVPWGWNLFISLSTIASACTMYLFLRSYRLPTSAKLFGAIVFSLGGPMSTWSEFGTGVWAMAMVPLLLLFVRTRKFVLIPATVLCLVLAGNVQILTYALPLVLVFSLVSAGLRYTVLTGLMLVLGLGLSAIQLLPTASMYGISMRSDEQYSSYFNYGLQPADQLIRLLIPDIFGHPVTGNYQNPYSYHEYTGYFGAITLILALGATIGVFFKSKSTQLRFFTLLFLASVFLAVDSPVTQLLFSRELPLFTYSSASRIFFLTVFAAAFLSARYLPIVQHYRRLLLFIMLIIFVLSINAILNVAPNQMSIAIKNSLLPLGTLGLLGISLFLPKKITPWILLMIISLDLFRFYTKYNPFVPARLIYPQTQATSYLASRSELTVVSISENSLPENTWVWYGVRSFEGYNPLHLESFNRFAQVANSQKYFNSPSRYAKIETPNLNLLRLSNVGLYVISAEQKTDYGIRDLNKVFAGEGLEIYEDLLAKPIRYTLPKVRTISTEVELATELESPDFDPDTALIYETLPPDSYLGIFTQAFAPGWTASADGQPMKILPVFGALTGVIAPNTINLDEIQLNYQAPGLFIGSLISLLGLVIYLLILKTGSKFRQKVI